MYRGNQSPFRYLWLVFLFIFISSGGFGALIPLVIIAAVVIGLMTKAVQASKENDDFSSPRRNGYSFANNSGRSSYSPAQLAKVNVFLRRYFQSHASMPVLADIDLCIHGRQYTSLSSLDVYRSGAYVCSLSDFGRRYPDMYNQILSVLVKQSESGQNSGEVFDAEVVENDGSSQTAAPQPEAAKEEEKPKKSAQDFIDEINQLNDDIPDKEISDGLYETCALLKQIQTLAAKFPASRPKLDKLYQYYLPILVNILQQYDNLQAAQSDPNYAPIKERLKQTLKLINDAMKTIIPSMTDNDFINLSADISTLEAVLQKDGLAGDNRMSQTSAPTENGSSSTKQEH